MIQKVIIEVHHLILHLTNHTPFFTIHSREKVLLVFPFFEYIYILDIAIFLRLHFLF
jgi:hypothetical protein